MAGRSPLRIGQHGKISRAQVEAGVWVARCRFRDLDLNLLFSTVATRRFRQAGFARSGTHRRSPDTRQTFPAASRIMLPYPNVGTPESPVVVKNRPREQNS
jgi:hypothetical protein